MFKNDIKSPQSKSVKSKKQTEINTTLNQNTAYGGKSKFEGGKKKKKFKVKTVVPEADESDQSSCSRVRAGLKTFKKKKSKSRSSSVLEEEQDSEMEKNPPESEIHEDTGGSLKKKKKRKNKSKPDGHSGPQNIPEGSQGKICVKEPSRVQDESKCNIKRKREDSVKNADAQEGLAQSNKTSNGTADKSDKMTAGSCVTEAKSTKKKKKRSHSEGIGTHEDKKSAKKRKREKRTAAPESGNDPFKLAAARKQRDEQILDTPSNKTDKKCKKKKTKAKLHTEERLLDSDRGHKGATVSVTIERKGVAQIECLTKSKKKKRKRSVDAEGGGIETLDKERMKLDKTSNVCQFQNSPAKATAKGKKQETAFDVVEESVEIEKKIKRKKRATSSGTHVYKVKEELCDSDDLQIMSEKKGNLFEARIDKARRQALQEEIDRVSSKTSDSETPASSEIKPSYTGTQWDTATFQSTEQKNKFLRLMGGLKSSNQPQSIGHSSGKPNMALNKQEEQKFNSTLQKEFDKALNLRQNRGIGLGYQPFPDHIQNETFFIDKSASKSKKFDF